MSDSDYKAIFRVYADHQHMLCERLQTFLQPLHDILRKDLIQALQEPGKILSQQKDDQHSIHEQKKSVVGLWPLLTMLIAESISPIPRSLFYCDVALAVECFICALDLLDDVEDEDNTTIVKTLGVARTLNVSTALLALSQQIIFQCQHHENVSLQQVNRLSSALQDALLWATAGQHRDLVAEQQDVTAFSIEECIEIAKWKAGSLLSMACYLGALCANAEEDLCQSYKELGTLLGISHQLDNDSHGLYYLLQNESASVASLEKSVSEKSDLVRGKKTLPVVLAYSVKPDITEHTGNLLDKNNSSVQAMHEGIISTWGVSVLYRKRAHACLQEIEKHYPASSALRLLLGL